MRALVPAQWLLLLAICALLYCLLAWLGEEEAQLTFKGATAGLAASGNSRCTGSDSPSSSCLCLVVDMGGRSTEFALGEHHADLKLLCTHSPKRCCCSSTIIRPRQRQWHIQLMSTKHTFECFGSSVPLHLPQQQVQEQ